MSRGTHTLATLLWRALQRRWLRVRIQQLEQLRAHPERWVGQPGCTAALLECRLAELRCELHAMEMQQP